MKRRAVVLTVLPAVLVSGFALATTSSARLVAAEPMGAVTTIRAGSSGSAELVLYDDATLSPRQTGNPDVSITGGGRLIAFNLGAPTAATTTSPVRGCRRSSTTR